MEILLSVWILAEVERPLLAVLLLVGLIIGCAVGSAYARARRGWNDYQTVRKSVPGARRGAWSLIRGVAVKAGVVALLLFGAAAYAAVGSDEETAGPPPSQSPTQSKTPHR
jgi:cytochrome c-type biogenesis protein CcmH/NrfG